MAGDTVQQIKDKLSIVDVVSQYVKLERAGRTLRARCPFHSERTPSFFVSAERGTYHCFGCNAGGDIFSFVEQIEGLDFKGALRILADKAGVPLVYEKREERDSRERLFELLETAAIFYAARLNEPAREYLHKRGISDETIKSFRIGLSGESWSEGSDRLRAKGFSEKEILDAGLAKRAERGLYDRFRSRIIFPIADGAGRIVGFSGRIFPPKADPPLADTAHHGEESSFEPPKYLNSPETELFHKSRILFGFDRAKQAIRKNNCAVLVEGQLDLLASHQAGWVNTVAVSGTAFTPEHAGLISRMTENLVIALDADEAGMRAAGRAARSALRLGLNVKVARLPEGKDPADLILRGGKEAWSKAIRESKDIIAFLLDVLSLHAGSAGKGPIQRDRFRKAVETIVLPFLADVQSPIARDQYARDIAGRLGVSEKAILDALSNVPRDGAADVSAAAAMSAGERPVSALGYGRARPASADLPAGALAKEGGYGRIKQAFSILLWQESRERPQLDITSYTKEFANAIGADAYKILRGLPENEKETLRFSAENLYGKSSGFERETKTLLAVLLRDRLAGELSLATSALKRAESEGDEKAMEEIVARCKLLTSQIAQLPR